jgi:hypothetical protein
MAHQSMGLTKQTKNLQEALKALREGEVGKGNFN